MKDGDATFRYLLALMQDKEYFKQGPNMRLLVQKEKGKECMENEFKCKGKDWLPAIEFWAGPGATRYFWYRGKLLWVNHWSGDLVAAG